MNIDEVINGWTFKNTFGEEYEGEVSCMEWLQSEAEQERI